MAPSNQELTGLRMSLPPNQDWRWCSFLYAVAIIFVFLAIFHLVRFRWASWITIAASLAWLLIIVASIRAAISDDGGFRQWLFFRINDVSRRHFVEVSSTEHETPRVRFGCMWFNCSIYILEIPIKAVSSVDWRTGQASSLAGRDMNDWHVTIWYRHPGRIKAKPFWVRSERLHIVSYFGSRTTIELFGNVRWSKLGGRAVP